MAVPIQEHTVGKLANTEHPELHGRLSGLAVLHETPIDPSETIYDIHGEYDHSSGQYLDRAAGSTLPGRYAVETATGRGTYHEAHRAYDSAEKTRALGAIGSVLAAEAREKVQGDAIDWSGVSRALLEKSESALDEERDTLLVGAVISAQFSAGQAQREEFLRTVYDRKLQDDMAAACRGSHLVILTGGPNAPGGDPNAFGQTEVHPVYRYAPAFEIDRERLDRYLAHIPPGASAPVADMPSAKKIQKELVAQARAGILQRDTQTQAEIASVSGEKVGQTILDLLKLKRFALEQYFIGEQSKAVLAGPDYAHSAFATRLEAARNIRNDITPVDFRVDDLLPEAKSLADEIAKLGLDMADAFRELSEPAKAKFSLEGANLEKPASFTPEQRAAWLFKIVMEYTEQHIALAQYLDFENFVERDQKAPLAGISRLNADIWTLSEEGGAAPTVAAEALAVIMAAACSPGAPRVTEDELAKLAHDNRRVLLGVATHHIEELAETKDGNALQDEAELTRDEHGTLQLKLRSALPDKESNEVYSAVILGCPALREISENRALMTIAEKAAYGSSNYVDHVLAAAINEAKARGIFDVGRWPAQDSDRSAVR